MDLQELEKYRPIPWGGLHILIWLLLVPLLAAFGCAYLATKIPGYPFDFWGAWVSSCAAMFVVGLSRRRRAELRDYWQKTVRAYNAWFWRDEKQKIQVSFTRRGKKGDEDSNPLPCPVIKVPLGGWFNSSGGVYRRHFNEVGLAQGWKVRFPSDPWRNALSPHVTLIDAEGHSITLGIGVALDFCEYYFTGDRTTEWLLPVDVMLEEIKRLSRERDEAKKRAEELERKWKMACQQREDALSAIAEAIGRIDATKRFIKSDQGQAIRTWLNGRLAAMAPVGAPGTVLGVRETLTQPAACEIGVRARETDPTAWDPTKRLPLF
ncbi:MAG: hypothetical protein WC348_04030 [Patescibacteria group bacterium]|jgi:hypothetical protein